MAFSLTVKVWQMMAWSNVLMEKLVESTLTNILRHRNKFFIWTKISSYS